jgi:hypothetical protein
VERDFDGGRREGERDGRRRGRHRSRSRRRREGFDYIELPDGEERLKEDPREQKSIALLVLAILVVVVAVCISIIMRSVEVETFAEM